MGLIREPKNIDFYVLDKPWTEEEKKEFSDFLTSQKKHQDPPKSRTVKNKLKKTEKVISETN